jgi:hypothetical protein
VSLVLEISKKWDDIRIRTYKLIKRSNVECMSLPVISNDKQKDKAKQILAWWEQVEQKSIEYGLDYKYLYHTDIANCYGSLYTHSIAWALHSKRVAKDKIREKSLIGNCIDSHIRMMSFGQTNGIPQGSVLMDFIAELVLLYIDSCFTLKLKRLYGRDIFSKVKILRYRDDFRIFTNDKTLAENCLKELSQLMIEFGFKLNTNKTIACDNAILGSVKQDKLEWLQIKKKAKKKKSRNIQEELLVLHSFLQIHKNCGTSEKILKEIWEYLDAKKEIDENVNVLISIVVDIAYNNPRTYPVSMALLSVLIGHLDGNKKAGFFKKTINQLTILEVSKK